MAWDQQLERAFSPNLSFAAHPTDEQSAFDWLVQLRQQKVGWVEAKRQITEFLRSQTMDSAHIAQQVANAEQRLRPWLLD